MNQFLDHLRSWLDADRFASKVLLAHSVTTGNQLLRMAAEAGSPAVNVHVTTVSGYVDTFSESALRKQGLKRIDSITSVMVLQQCMRSFRGAFTTMGKVETATAQSVLNMLNELEGNGVEPEQLRACGESLLSDLWDEYLHTRARLGYASFRDIFAAVRIPDKEQFAILSNLRLNRLETDFVRLIPQDRLTVIQIKTPGGEPVPRDMPFQAAAAEEPVSDWPECVSCQDIGTEVRGAFQYLAEHDIPAEDAVFVCPNADYGLRAEETGRQLGIGVSSVFGKPASIMHAAQLIRCIQKWGAGNYDAECLTPVLTEGGMALYNPDDNRVMVGQELLRIFREEAVGWGRDRWEKLSRAENNRHRAVGEMMYDWVSLFEEGDMPAREIAAKLTAVLHKCMAHGPDNDLFYKTIDEISRLYTERMTVSDYLTFVQNVTDSQIVEAHHTDEPGKVYCCALENALYVNRKHFFMLGMSWDVFDRLTPEFALLHDAEKAQLSPMLLLAGDAALGRRYSVRELLANRPDTHVIFSYARADHPGGTDILASSLIDDAAVKYGGTKKIPQVNILERAPLTGQDLRLAYGYRAPADELLLPETGKQEWATYISEKIYSPTSLENALACPRMFVFKNVLHMKAEDPEPLDPTSDSWMDPLTRGTLAHSVLCQYFNTVGSHPGMLDTDMLRSLLDQAIALEKEALPVPVYLDDPGSETEKLWTSLKRAAEMFAADPERVIAGTEIGFGDDGTEPVELTFGEHVIHLRGSIDRVDSTPDGMEIIDYKTGKPKNFKNKLDHKLQYYLYTLAWEKLHPDKPVHKACYYLIDSESGIEKVEFDMNQETRGSMYEKMCTLLDVLADQGQAFSANYEVVPQLTDSAGKSGHPDCRYCDYREICELLRVE